MSVYKKEQELNKLYNDRKSISLDIKAKKRECHKEYIKTRKGIFITLDVLMVLAILCNIGALVLTNALVLKNNPNKQFVELNPIMAEHLDIQAHKDPAIPFTQFIVNIMAWAFIIIWYINARMRVYRSIDLGMLMGTVIFLFTAWSLDFFNDFGYWIGVKIFGG